LTKSGNVLALFDKTNKHQGNHMSDTSKPPFFRRILAGILDIITSFGGFGYIIAKLTGNTTETGFELSGANAGMLFALVIVYFVGMNKFAGGTIWKHILGIAGK
jgi:hypothetical protein